MYLGHADRPFVVEYLSLYVGELDCIMIDDSYSTWLWLVITLTTRREESACQHRQRQGTGVQGIQDPPHQLRLPMRVEA